MLPARVERVRPARRREIRIRLFVVGVALAAGLGGWFWILPSLPDQVAVRQAATTVFVIRLALGVALLIVDRRWPQATGRVTTEPSVWWLALGVVIFLGEQMIVLAAVGFCGLVIPASFLRFRMSD